MKPFAALRRLHRRAGLVAALVATVACNASAADAPLKLGFAVKAPNEGWFQLEWKFAGQAADELGFTLVKIAATDRATTLAAIDALAASGAGGLVICTPDVTIGPEIVARAQAKNLKLITVDDRLVGTDGKPMTEVPYLGISAGKIGFAVGKTLAAEVSERHWTFEETAACVVTFDELGTAKERTDNAIAALKAGGFAPERIFTAPQKTQDLGAAQTAVAALLDSNPAAKRWVICGANDTAVLGAVRAMEAHGVPTNCVIGIGINGTDCIAELATTTPTGFYGSMLLSAKQHGYETAKMLYEWVHDGKEPPLETRTVGVLINRWNFKKVLKDQGITE